MTTSKYQVTNVRKFMEIHESGPVLRSSNAEALDVRIQRRLFDSPSSSSRKKKRNFEELETSNNYEDFMSSKYTPQATRTFREKIYLPTKDEICAAKRIDADLRSSNLVWGVPDEQDEDGLGEFKELVQGEITPGSVVEFPTSHFLTVTQAPPAWTVHQAFEYLQATRKDICTKLENVGHVRIPKADVKPPKCPGESSQANEMMTWRTMMAEHCHRYSAEAYRIFVTLQYNYPILPKPEDLARELVKKDMHERDQITDEDMEACILDWSIDNLPNSSQNRQYHEGRQWLDAQLRLAVKEVDVLKNKIISILPSEVVEIMMAIETHYTELDDFDKWRVSRPFDMLEVKDGQTLRQFSDLEMRALIALRRLGVEISEERAKLVYFFSAFKIYGHKGFQSTAREWAFNTEIKWSDCRDQYEFLLKSHHVDPDLSWKLKESELNKRHKSKHPVEELTQMADNVISFENFVPTAKEASVNYSKKMCDNQECNKVRTATHTSDECWRKHPELIPDNLKNKFNKRKNDYSKVHRKGFASQEKQRSDDKTKDYVKKARKFLKARYEANHTREPDYSLDDNVVYNLAYFNYAKANKLKVKASKKIKKLLGNLDDNIKASKADNSKKLGKKSDGEFDASKFDGPKTQCGKCGKWGNHTAEECRSGEKPSKSDEANHVDCNKSNSKARVVEKIHFSNHNDSDEEEDTLHYHRDNRIKATNISSEDYAFFVRANSGRASGSELGLKLGGDTCHESEETRGHNAFMAQSRGYVKDTTVADDEQSTSSDVESEDELSGRDDTSSRLRTSKSTEGKATEINLAQPQEIEGASDNVTHREITARSTTYSSQSATSRFMRATDPEIMDEHKVNTSRKRLTPNSTSMTTTITSKSESSGNVQEAAKPKPEVIDLSIEDIEDMFQTDVQEQAAIAAASKAESEAEEEARRTGNAVKRKKNDNSYKTKSRRDSPGPDKDKGKRFA